MKLIINGETVEAGGTSLPPGGTIGQALVKASDADGDVVWGDVGGGPALQSLSITTPPAKTLYSVGDTFDPTGMETYASFSGDSGIYVDKPSLSFAPSVGLSADDTAIEVSFSFGGKTVTADQPVTVRNFEWWSPHMTSNNAPAPYAAAASSIYWSESDAYHAFDGNVNTWWHVKQGENTPQWVSFDFGKNTGINGIRMYRRYSSNSLKDLPYSFVVQGSYDGKNWADILNVENAPDVTDASVPREHMFDNVVSYRMYRLYDLIGSIEYRSIAEIEFSKLEVHNDT